MSLAVQIDQNGGPEQLKLVDVVNMCIGLIDRVVYIFLVDMVMQKEPPLKGC